MIKHPCELRARRSGQVRHSPGREMRRAASFAELMWREEWSERLQLAGDVLRTPKIDRDRLVCSSTLQISSVESFSNPQIELDW